MAKIKKFSFITGIHGTISSSDRTIGRESSLAINIKRTRNGMILSSKHSPSKTRSAARLERTAIYCNCDEGYKFLSLTEREELESMRQEWNKKYKRKTVKTLYHFYMKWCMSNLKTPLVNCSYLEADMYNCDLDSADNLYYTGYAATYFTHWPSIDRDNEIVFAGKAVKTKNGLTGIASCYNQDLSLPWASPYSAMLKTYVSSTYNPSSAYIRFGYIVDVVPVATTDPKKFKFRIIELSLPFGSFNVESKDYNLDTHHTVAFTFGRTLTDSGHNAIVYIDGSPIHSFYSQTYGNHEFVNFYHPILSNIKIHSAAWNPTRIKNCSDKINPIPPEL